MTDSKPKTVVIVGGGTAGWMAANLFLHRWPDTRITLVESKSIGTIGVGEGSTPYLKEFFRLLGIADKDWMPACNATYKAGIRFCNWSLAAGYESYFHPFYSRFDLPFGDAFFQQCNAQRRGAAQAVHPDDYFVANRLAELGLAPLPIEDPGFEVDYGYHFDAGLLGDFLRKRALALGLNYKEAKIESVSQGQEGEVDALLTDSGESIKGDFYIDCSGFRGLLVNQTYQLPFRSFSDNLFNNAAVTLASPADTAATLIPETRATALGHGWVWRIPLQNRVGNGYVYSSDFIDPEQAEAELARHLGLDGKDHPSFRHIQFRTGRLEEHWHKNCLAVGLSQGFVEPLEATALMLVQFTLERFIAFYDRAKPPLRNNQTSYNANVNGFIESIRDYIVTHYKCNSRTDTDYWRACREEARTSSRLQGFLDAWQKGQDFDASLAQAKNQLAYLRPSWYVILAGMGYFPPTNSPASLSPRDNPVSRRARQATGQVAQRYFGDHRQNLAGGSVPA